MANVRVIDERQSVHSDPNLTSPIIAELHAGDEFSLGKTVTASGVTWCAATLPNGRTGYVDGSIKILRIRPVTLAQGTVEVLASPAAGSTVISTCNRGDRFTLTGMKKQCGTSWVEVRTDSGGIGFIPEGTKIAEIASPTAADSSQGAREIAQKNLVHGALWLVGGIAVTAITYNIASSSPEGGHYLIAWGAIIFGGIQFLKGLVGVMGLSD